MIKNRKQQRSYQMIRAEFARRFPGPFGWLFRNNRSLLDRILSTDNKKWTKEIVKAEALKYQTRLEWAKKSPRSYSAAHRNKWMDESCAHMEYVQLPNGYWTLEKCKTEALKYSSRSQWQKVHKSSYSAAHKNKWIDECSAHMLDN